MIRRYCDGCMKEITDQPSGRLVGRIGRIAVEVMVAIDGTWNADEVCADCIRAVCAIAEPQQMYHLQETTGEAGAQLP